MIAVENPPEKASNIGWGLPRSVPGQEKRREFV